MAKDLTCSAGIENKYEDSRKKWFGAFTYKIMGTLVQTNLVVAYPLT
jgi:hypothetical protein